MCTLDIIVPVFNEEDCLDEILRRLNGVKDSFKNILDVSFLFVNDGPRDKSADILKAFSEKYDYVKVINFARNFGHQIAVTAGINNTNAD